MREFQCEIVRVVDGDTIDVRVDLGFDVHLDIRTRLIDIDTPEVRGPEREEGIEVRGIVQQLLPVGTKTTLLVFGRGKYGRWISDILLTEEESLCDFLVENGLAVVKDY